MSSLELTKNEKLDAIALNFEQVIRSALEKFDQTAGFKIFYTTLCFLAKSNKRWWMEHAGTFFYRYKDEIVTKDLEFFTDRHDYKDQLDDWLSITKGYGESMAIGFVDILKTNVKKLFNKGDTQDGYRIVKQLLNLYIKYMKVELESD